MKSQVLRAGPHLRQTVAYGVYIHLIFFSPSGAAAWSWPGPSALLSPSPPPNSKLLGLTVVQRGRLWALGKARLDSGAHIQGYDHNGRKEREDSSQKYELRVKGCGIQAIYSPDLGLTYHGAWSLQRFPVPEPSSQGLLPSMTESSRWLGCWSLRESRGHLEFQPPLCLLALQQNPGEDGQPSVEPEHHGACHGEPRPSWAHPGAPGSWPPQHSTRTQTPGSSEGLHTNMHLFSL